jgi:hypothetical protein
MSNAAKCQAIDIEASTEAVTSLPRVPEVDSHGRCCTERGDPTASCLA